MSTILVVYIFYISLGGIIALLSYKMFMICKGHHAKKSGVSEHEFFAKTCLVVSDKICILLVSGKKHFFPVVVCVKHNIRLTCRGCSRFINDMQSGREKPGTIIESDGVASTYLKNILAQKKRIQKKNNKVFHSENL